MKPEQTTLVPSVPSVPVVIDGHAVLVPTIPDQERRVARVKQYHKELLRTSQDQAMVAGLAGAELLLMKAQLPHKFFTPFVEQHFGTEVTLRSCQRYMAVVKDLIAKNATVSLLLEQATGEGGLNGDRREQYLLAWHEFADGKTITSLMRDCGAIRDPKEAKKHPRKEANPIATEEEQTRQANEHWCMIAADVELALENYERCTPETRDRVMIAFLKITKLDRSLGKGKRRKSQISDLKSQIVEGKQYYRGYRNPEGLITVLVANAEPPEECKERTDEFPANTLEHAMRQAKVLFAARQRGPKQETWIAYRTADGAIFATRGEKFPPAEDWGKGTQYEGPFNASGQDHANAKARMLFAPLKRLMAPAQKKQWKAEQKKSGAKPSRMSPDARAKLAAAARNRWAEAVDQKKGATK